MQRKVDLIVHIFCIGLLLMYPLFVYAATITDTTCAVGQFGGGTHSDTECNSNQLQLDATGKTNGSGNFTSRIMDAGSSAIWSALG